MSSLVKTPKRGTIVRVAGGEVQIKTEPDPCFKSPLSAASSPASSPDQRHRAQHPPVVSFTSSAIKAERGTPIKDPTSAVTPDEATVLRKDLIELNNYLNEDNQKVKAEKKELEDENKELKAEIKELEAKCKEFQEITHCQKWVLESNEKDKTELKKKNINLKREIEQLEHEKKELEAKIKELEGDMKELEDKIEEREDHKAQTEGCDDDMEEELVRLHKQIRDFEAQTLCNGLTIGVLKATVKEWQNESIQSNFGRIVASYALQQCRIAHRAVLDNCIFLQHENNDLNKQLAEKSPVASRTRSHTRPLTWSPTRQSS